MNIEAGERIAMELPELVLFSQSDITSEEDVLKAIARTDHKWPTRTVGGLVHCGGIGMAGKVSLEHLASTYEGAHSGATQSVDVLLM